MAKTIAQQQLLLAAKSGNSDATLHLLVEDGVYINCKDTLGFTPLTWAMYYNHFNVIELLVSYAANLNAKTLGGQTPLHVGACKGNVDGVSLLCKAGANPNICAKNGFTPLHEASSAGKMECAQILLEYKSAVNIKSNEGFTPLHFACSKGYLSICQLLLDHGAAFEATDSAGRTPLHVAATNSHGKPIVELLLKRGASPLKKCARNFTALQYAIDSHSATCVPILKLAESRYRQHIENYPELIEIKGSGGGQDVVNYHPNPVNYASPSHKFVHIDENEFENAIKVRVDEVRKQYEAKLEQKDMFINQLISEKEKTDQQHKQQQQKVSQDLVHLQDQLKICQKQMEIGRTEKASTQLDLEITQKKLSLITSELQSQISAQQRLNDQMAQLEESRTCKICFEEPVDTILFPCSHFCLCHGCTVAVVKKNKKCPICRSSIERSSLCYFT